MLKASPTFEQSLTQASRLVDDKQFTRARELLRSLPTQNIAERRMALHSLSRSFMREGDFDHAVAELAELQKQGSHVGTLSDLASSLYHQGNLVGWRHTMEQLRGEYERCHPQLSPKSLARTCKSIGNFLEEEGRIHEALALYLEALPRLEAIQYSDENFLLLAQILRIHSTFSLNPRAWRKDYTILLGLKERKPSLYLSFEVQHALLLAETAWIGIEVGLARLNSLFTSPDVLPHDKALFYFDFLEEVLNRAPTSKNSVIISHTAHATNPFEEAIAALWDKKCEALQISQMTFKMTQACRLRVLFQFLKQKPQDRSSEDFLRLALTILDQLPASSRKLWLTRYQAAIGSIYVPQNLRLCPLQKTVNASTGEVSFANRRTSYNLLRAFVGHSQLSLDKLTQKVWGAHYNPSYYHRIRIALGRLNRELLPLTGHEDFFSFDKVQVTVKGTLL